MTFDGFERDPSKIHPAFGIGSDRTIDARLPEHILVGAAARDRAEQIVLGFMSFADDDEAFHFMLTREQLAEVALGCARVLAQMDLQQRSN